MPLHVNKRAGSVSVVEKNNKQLAQGPSEGKKKIKRRVGR